MLIGWQIQFVLVWPFWNKWVIAVVFGSLLTQLKSSYTFLPHPCLWMCCPTGVGRLALVESSAVQRYMWVSANAAEEAEVGWDWNSSPKGWSGLQAGWSSLLGRSVRKMIWVTPRGQGGRSRSSEPDSEQRRAVGSDGFFFGQPLAGLDIPMYSEYFFLATLWDATSSDWWSIIIWGSNSHTSWKYSWQ